MNNIRINKKYNELVKAILKLIESKFDKIENPFLNPDDGYKNKVFAVHGYKDSYHELGGDDINFNYKNGAFCATWYKSFDRGLYFWSKTKKKINGEFLNNMLKDCLESLQEDFGDADEQY